MGRSLARGVRELPSYLDKAERGPEPHEDTRIGLCVFGTGRKAYAWTRDVHALSKAN